MQRHHERDAAAEAEPDDPDVLVGEPLCAQMVECGVDVGEHRGVAAHGSEQLHHRVPVAVLRSAAAGAMEEVGGDRVVPGGGEPAGDILDVVVDAERLLDHDDRRGGLGVAVGDRLVAAHGAVGGLEGA